MTPAPGTPDELARAVALTFSFIEGLPDSAPLFLAPDGLHALQILRDQDPACYALQLGAIGKRAPRYIADTIHQHVGRAKHGSNVANSALPPIVALEIGELLQRDFPAKEPLLSPWLRRQDLVMVHAWRGVGKTHFAMGVAYAVAGGGAFLCWKADKPRRVIYVDGEMPGAAIKERAAALVASSDEIAEPPEGYFRIVTPDAQEAPIPDLATPEGQAAIAEVMGDAELIVIDNLSCLVRSGIENDGESWLPMATWALRMRREGRTVLFVQHEGKNGLQRGTSRREDLLDVVLKLQNPSDYNPEEGARFEVRFKKARGLYGEAVKEIEATLSHDKSGSAAWTWREVAGATVDRVIELQADGMSTAEIAAELGVNRSTVYRAIKRARAEGRITAGDSDGAA